MDQPPTARHRPRSRWTAAISTRANPVMRRVLTWRWHAPVSGRAALLEITEQAVGHAAVSVGGTGHAGDETWMRTYLYSRSQSVMGGTSQIQRNLIAQRILGMPT